MDDKGKPSYKVTGLFLFLINDDRFLHDDSLASSIFDLSYMI